MTLVFPCLPVQADDGYIICNLISRKNSQMKFVIFCPFDPTGSSRFLHLHLFPPLSFFLSGERPSCVLTRTIIVNDTVPFSPSPPLSMPGNQQQFLPNPPAYPSGLQEVEFFFDLCCGGTLTPPPLSRTGSPPLPSLNQL